MPKTLIKFDDFINDMKQNHRFYVDGYNNDFFNILNNRGNSNVEIMLELLKFKKTILKKEYKDCDQFERYIAHDRTISRHDEYYTFTELKTVFYKEYPMCIPNSGMENLIEEIQKLNLRLTRIEQFQANILDKISVLAEIIDSK